MTTSDPDQDPAGHYAVLDIQPGATAEEITAAYRRVAKRLHPDVPVTGDRAAFLRLQEAYQTLGDPIRRAAYDHAAGDHALLAAARPSWRQEEQELAFVPPLSWRLPPYLGAGLVLLTLLAIGQFGWRFIAAPPTQPTRATLPQPHRAETPTSAAPMRISQVSTAADAIIPDPAAAPGDHFIAPATSPAVLWQRPPDRPGIIRAGQLPAFTTVTLLRPAGDDGQAEIRTAAGQTGFMEAARLFPGDARAARHAACLYNAGAPPRGGSLLVSPATAQTTNGIRVQVENREDRPAVFKLRDAANTVAAAVYVAARGQATIDNLRPGPYRAEFAIGDLWSAPCGMFMAGMRAQRLPEAQDLTGPARFSISARTPAEDIADDAFSRQ